MRAVVTGVASHNALGSLSASWERLRLGESGLAWRQLFPELGARSLGAISERPAELPTLTEALARAVLRSAGLAPPLPDCAVAVGSSRGCQAAWERQVRAGQSGQFADEWQALLPDAAARTVARAIGTERAVRSPMAACATGLWAIAQGAQAIQAGECDCVAVGAVEAPLTPLTLAGFERMGALAKRECRPFDRRRDGFALGEGGALFVLESAERARSRGARVWGEVRGWGLTNDAERANAPAGNRRPAIAAIQACLKRSQLRPQQINFIHAHGTGTRLNDAAEAEAIAQVFGDRVPVSSTKGATGHTLGASGAIGLAFCLLAIRDKWLPPTVGLGEPEFAIDVVSEARACLVSHALCLSFGFGGQNAAIAVSGWS